ncbi:MAG: MFS transporter [Gemmataceae bacterium]|nr:MFS transporter [Gemmataceae bacterium]
MPQAPTRVRYLVVLLTLLAAVLLYLDRFCISFAERYIKEDLGLSNAQVGLLFSAFFLTYALAQVPTGFLGDRYGARRVLTLYILLWSLFTALTGLAGGFLVLIAYRLGFGVAQAGAYPTSAVLVGGWVPITARGTASSLVAFGGRIGGFIAPLLTALLIVQFVPVSVPSQFTPDDILDYAGLRERLGKEPARIGQRLLTGLPESEGQARESLAGRLNELLTDPRLAADSYFDSVALPQEARELRGRPWSELSASERERLNRLLLEAAYPEGLRKVYTAGWRPVMITFGLAGLVIAVLYWLMVRDRPAQHPWCNAAEVRLIDEGRPQTPSGKASRAPLRELVSNGPMWLMCLTQMGTNVGWVFLVTWLPRYLDEVHRLPIEERGVLASIPLMVGWAGMLVGGWATDRLTRAVGPRWGRALPLALSRFLAVSAYLTLYHFDMGPYAATAAFAVVAFATDFGSPSVWAFNLDVGGRYIGSVLGWGNMWGNLGAALSPPLLNWVLERYSWDAAFLTCAVAFLISGLCALGIDASRPIAPDEPGERRGLSPPS